MKYYDIDQEEVLKILSSSRNGLSLNEVNEKLKKDGLNKLKGNKKQSSLSKFLSEFKDLMIIILIISSIISFILSLINNESFMDSIIILAIVILNAILGFIQELKADKAIDSLKKLQVTKVKVKRDNNICIINSEEIVKGDILILEAGDTIPADARLIWEASLKVDESSLTGESLPVNKSIKTLSSDVSLSERKNMIYSGTSVVYGKCIAVVTGTGMNTEIGKIASSLNEEEKEITPLQIKMDEISKILSLIIAVIIVIMMIVGFIKGMGLAELIMLSISLAVAAIPEGLPAVITITLSLGMSSMAKKKAIVRKMSSVETLGCTEIICSDKTGTITQNKMKIREIYYNNKIYTEKELLNENMLLDIMILNNDVCKSESEYIGDPTEIALYNYCEQSINIDEIKSIHERINELPFDSDRKMMSTINKFSDCNKILTKGSFDSIIRCCDRIFEDGKIIKLTDEKIKELKNIEINESNKALRVLSYAYSDLNNKYELSNELENNLIFVGMTCMMDPPREDVEEAIKLCKSAHIKPIMITGDSLSTATSIAKEIGILEKDEEAILGIDLDKYNEEELKEVVKKYSVYARVSPINKLSIVNAWKDNNKVVAMTGDGVNDAPALKNANIGVGMGITGTEVSKGVSDIILSDDSFSTIVTAVKEGRRIYDNIRNVLVYLLTGNIAEVLIVFIGMIFGLEIFLPIQLLYINLITDSIPAIALAFEKEQKDIMDRNIRKKDSSFFTPFLVSKMTVSSILKTIAVLLVYFTNKQLYGLDEGTSMAFLTLILLEMNFAYSCRNQKKSIFETGLFGNSYINKSMIVLGLIQVIIFVTPIKSIFGITTLSILQVLYCFAICICIFIMDELIKPILSKNFKD